MIGRRDTMDLERLSKVPCAVNQRLRQETLSLGPFSICDQQRVFRKLCSPRQHSGNQRGVQRILCVRRIPRLQVQFVTKLLRVEERKARVHDLKVDFDEVEGESGGENTSE